MENPNKKFEIEIGVIGVWFTELDEQGKCTENSLYLNNKNLEIDINDLTVFLQTWFNF